MAIRLAGGDIRDVSPVVQTLAPPTDSFSINGRLVGSATAPDLVDVDARARTGNSTISLVGRFPDVLALPELDARFVVEGDDLSTMGAHIGRPWPSSRSYRFSARASGSTAQPVIEDIEGSMRTDELLIEIDGRIGDILESRDFDLDIQAQADSLVPFLPWGGYLWEALGESTASFNLRGGPDTFEVDLEGLSAGRSSLQGRFDLSLGEAREIKGIRGGFTESVLHREVLCPPDLERIFALRGGNIFHGAMSLDRLGFMRPLPGCARYQTPIRNLYLCGAGTHPGGGVMGACGRNAAKEVIRQLT